MWPYNVSKFAVRPTVEAYAEAKKRTISEYQTLTTLVDMLEVLSSGKPIVAGMVVYEPFMTLDHLNATISLPFPDQYEIGGHAVCIVGYSLADQKFIVKNSFGKEWGDNGYFYMPFEYARQYVFEKWAYTIQLTLPIS